MANEINATGTPIGAKGGMGKSIAILAAIALVCRVVTLIALGAAFPSTGLVRFLSEVVGAAVPSFLVGLIVFFIVRFFRRGSGAPFAGVLSGAIVAIAICYPQYLGELNHLNG